MSQQAAKSDFRYEWFSRGDIDGFFGVMFDNITVLSFMAFILSGIFGMPADIVLTRMVPGTAFGVLFGDLAYSWMAFTLAKRTKKHVTAMPLGLDTPSTIGVAFAVLGPAYASYVGKGMGPEDAAMQTWYVGMATMMYVGIFKTIFSFAGNYLNRIIPQAALLGSLAGVGLALIGFSPILEILGAPLIGMLAIGIVLYTLVAKIELPFRIPGVLAAVVIGTILYYICAPLGICGNVMVKPEMSLTPGFPWPTLGFVNGLKDALLYLPVAIPFSILTVVGGINVTESARLAGDDYSTRDILLVEAAATLIAGVCGGVAQSTPYIGQPAFKSMGCRSGYTVLTGLFIGIGGMLGIVGFIVAAIPKAVLAPILVFVALDIVAQAFNANPGIQSQAVAFALLPNIARTIKIQADYHPDFEKLFSSTEQWIPGGIVINTLANGFILISMLWGAFLSLLLSKKLRTASLYLVILAVLSFFGIVHSIFPDGNMYLPWNIVGTSFQRSIPYQYAIGYLALAGLIFGLSFTKEAKAAVEAEAASEKSEPEPVEAE